VVAEAKGDAVRVPRHHVEQPGQPVDQFLGWLEAGLAAALLPGDLLLAVTIQLADRGRGLGRLDGPGLGGEEVGQRLAASVGDRDGLTGDRDVLLAQQRDPGAAVQLVQLQRGLGELVQRERSRQPPRATVHRLGRCHDRPVWDPSVERSTALSEKAAGSPQQIRPSWP